MAQNTCPCLAFTAQQYVRHNTPSVCSQTVRRTRTVSVCGTRGRFGTGRNEACDLPPNQAVNLVLEPRLLIVPLTFEAVLSV